MKRILTALACCCVAVSAGAQNFEFVSFVDYYGGIEPSEGYEHLRSRVFMRPTLFGVADKIGLEWRLSCRH